MDRQLPSAEGTGPTVRRPTGRRSDPRLSALRYPLMGMRRVRNRQFGTTVRRDAPRGNAPARRNNARRKDDAGLQNQTSARVRDARLLRFARNDGGCVVTKQQRLSLREARRSNPCSADRRSDEKFFAELVIG